MSAERLEFWPDYSGALLHAAGKPIPLEKLPLPVDLVNRATAWVGRYEDSKLPFGDGPDPGWKAEGQASHLRGPSYICGDGGHRAGGLGRDLEPRAPNDIDAR